MNKRPICQVCRTLVARLINPEDSQVVCVGCRDEILAAYGKKAVRKFQPIDDDRT